MASLEYKKNYKEKEFIGRGNFGSATLVERIDTKCNYIAKKIILTNLDPKQQEAALQEASLLKNLHHKNIVAYVESFKEADLLIIVMEYCEHGDLGFHIKRKKQKKAYFPEMLIVNMFYELALAIKYIHERKILHRDIKTTNIFITKDGTIKIGDFGISKVLEHTTSVAKTVVGTPYYMSPEVCESKPYTYKSDIWALGCVLFELCSLEHPFESNNLLGLLFKIVKEEPPAIPNIYSKELSQLISKLLSKDELLRPTIQEILNDESTQRLLGQYLEARPATSSTTQQTNHTETSQIETISEESCATLDGQNSSKENSLNSNGQVGGQGNTTGSSGSGTSAPLSVVDSQVFQLQYSQLASFNKEETLDHLELRGQQATPSQTETFSNKHVCKVSKRMIEAAEFAAEEQQEQSHPQQEELPAVEAKDEEITKLNKRLNGRGVACDTNLASQGGYKQKLTSPMSAKFSRIGLKPELSFQIRDKGITPNEIERQQPPLQLHQRNKSDHNVGTPQERRLKQLEQINQQNDIFEKLTSTKNPSSSRENTNLISNQCLLKLNSNNIGKNSVIKDYAEKIEPYKNNFLTPKQKLLNLQGKSFSSQLTETVFSSQVPLPYQNSVQKQQNVYEEIDCFQEPAQIRARGQSEYSAVSIVEPEKRKLNNNIYQQIVPVKSQFSLNSNNSGSSKNLLSKQSDRVQSGTKRSSFCVRNIEVQNQSNISEQTMFQDIPISKRVIEEQEKRSENKGKEEEGKGKEQTDVKEQQRIEKKRIENTKQIERSKKGNETAEENYHNERFEEYFSEDEEEEKKTEIVVSATTPNIQAKNDLQSLNKLEANRRQSEIKSTNVMKILPLRSASSSKNLAIQKSNTKQPNQLDLKSMLHVKAEENKQILFNGNQSRLESLRQRCKQNMGEYFDKVYAIIQKSINENLQKYKMKQMLVEIVGKERINDCFEVEMLIYQEEEERNRRK